MSMNYSDLKIAFREYLIKLKEKEGDKSDIEDDINIFEYASEFKDFLKQNEEFDLDSQTMKMDNLLSLDASEIDDYLEQAKNDFAKNEDEEFFFDFIGDLTSSDKMIEAVDIDGDGSISGEELQGFFATVGKNDGDDENVSISDIFGGIKDINNNKFEMVDLADFKSNTAQETQAVQSSGGSGGGYSSGGGSYNSASSASSASSQSVAENSSKYEGMSLDELNTELEQETANNQQNQEAFTAALNGTSSEVSGLKEQTDAAYSSFLDLSDDTEAKQEISDKRALLDEMEISTTNLQLELMQDDLHKQELELNISTIEQQITSIDSSVTSLNSQKSALEASDGQEDENGNVVDNSAQIAAIDAQITALNEQKEALENEKIQCQNEVRALTTQIEEKNTSLEDQNRLYETEAATLTEMEEALIAQNEEAQAAYDNYVTCKQNYDQKRSEVINVAANDIQNSQTNMILIQNQIRIAEFEQSQQELSEDKTDTEESDEIDE